MNSNKQYILLMIKRFENRFLMNILVHLLTLHRWRVDCQNIEVVFTGFAYTFKRTDYICTTIETFQYSLYTK